MGPWIFFLIGLAPLIVWLYLAGGQLLLARRSGVVITPRGLAVYGTMLFAIGSWFLSHLLELFGVLDLPTWLSTARLVAYLLIIGSLGFGIPIKKLFRERVDVEEYIRRGNAELEAGRSLDEAETLREALDYYLEAIHASPGNWAGHFGASLALFEVGMRSASPERESLLERAMSFGVAARKLAATKAADEQTQDLIKVIGRHSLSSQMPS